MQQISCDSAHNLYFDLFLSTYCNVCLPAVLNIIVLVDLCHHQYVTLPEDLDVKTESGEVPLWCVRHASELVSNSD